MKKKLLWKGTPAFCAGLVMAAVLTALGACGGFSPDGATDSETLSGKTGNEEGLVTVKVRVSPPQSQSEGARSVDLNSAQFYANFYEVVFKDDNGTEDADDDAYYRGVGTPTQGYINVAVPPGEGYKALLLAGINRTLVAAAFEEDVPIVAGIDNLVIMKLAVYAPQWDVSFDNAVGANYGGEGPKSNDFVFEAALSVYETDGDPHSKDVVIDKKNRLVNVAPFVEGEPDKGAGDIDPDNDIFTVKYNLGGWGMLIDAEKFSEENDDALRFAYYDAYVHHRYMDDKFTTIVLDITEACYDWDTGKFGEAGVVSFINKDSGNHISKLPARDTDGLLVFKLYYYAFGAPESEGVLWTIKNGLYSAADNPDGVAELDGQGDPTGKGATLGSYIPIRFGKGTPANLQNTTVSIPIGN